MTAREGSPFRFSPLALLAAAAALAGFFLFYRLYVPLVPAFQVCLAPLLFICFISFLFDPEKGVQVFVFVLPLINVLPHLFHFTDRRIPHAPAAAVLFLAFFCGWAIRRTLIPSPWGRDESILVPMVLLSSVLFASGLVTGLRFANFAPFLADKSHDLILNVNSVRAGGGIMSTVFGLLYHLSGFFFFLVLVNTVRTAAALRRLIGLLALSLGISLGFAVIQRAMAPGLGNSRLWTSLGQINATFKDPNSFGVVLAALFPLLAGLALSSAGWKRAVLSGLIVLGGAVFPFIGSRSPLLGIILTSSLFLYLSVKFFRPDRRTKRALGYALAAALVVGPALLFIFRGSTLAERSFRVTDTIFRGRESASVLSGKSELWTVAVRMIRDYPLTGVGLGSFIVELPNYGQRLGLTTFRDYTDSAENLYLHLGAETGLLGLGLGLWLLWEVIRKARRGWGTFPRDSPNAFLFIGSISSVACFLINFLFHSYVGSYEVNFVFWTAAAALFVLARLEAPLPQVAGPAPRRRIGLVLTALVLGLVGAGAHLRNSLSSLSISAKTGEFGWDQDFGLYQLEKDPDGRFYRWTRTSAGITVERLGNRVVIPLKAAHPDIARRPLLVKLFLGGPDFAGKSRLREVVLRDHSWHEVECDLSLMEGPKLFLIIETARSWEPGSGGNVPDDRALAVGLGEVWYEYPDEFPGPESALTLKVGADQWAGPQKNILLASGESHLDFAASGPCLIRLRARGSKARGRGPIILVRLDSELIAKTCLNDEDWSSLVLPRAIAAGTHRLSVTYDDDLYVDETEDRNVELGEIELHSTPRIPAPPGHAPKPANRRAGPRPVRR